MIDYYLDLVMSLSLKPFFNMPCQVTLFSSSKFFCSQINLQKQEVKIRISASFSREHKVIFICSSFVVFAITRHHLKTFFDNFYNYGFWIIETKIIIGNIFNCRNTWQCKRYTFFLTDPNSKDGPFLKGCRHNFLCCRENKGNCRNITHFKKGFVLFRNSLLW